VAELKVSFGPRQAALNGASTALAFGLSVAIGIWFTPFLIGRIGPESYGLVMLAAVVVSYAGPVVQALSTTLALEFARARASTDEGALQSLFAQAIGLSVRIVLVLAPLVAALTLLGPGLLGVSPGYRAEASWILLLTALSFLVWVPSGPFGALLYTANRIDCGNYAQAVQLLVRVFGAVVLLEWVTRSSIALPAAALGGSIASLVLVIVVTRRITTLAMRPTRAMLSTSMHLVSSGATVLSGSVAFMLLLGTELLVVNYMTDEARTGMYAAAIQIAVLVRAAMLTMSNLFGPRVIARVADGDMAEARLATAEAMRLLGILVAFPAGVVLAAGPTILEVWLGPAYAAFAPALQWAMISTLVLVSALPLYTLTIAAGRKAVPSAIRGVAFIGYIVLAVALFRGTSLGVIGVAAALAAAIAVAELVLMVPYTGRITGSEPLQFYRPFASIGLALAASAVATALLLSVWAPRSIAALCLFGSLAGVPFALVAMMLVGRARLVGIGTAILRREAAAV